MHEPAGFRDWVAARSPALLRTARLITGDRVLAEDLVQTALARTWPRFERVENPDVYVRTVLLRTYLSWRRRRWHGETPTAETPEAHRTPDLDTPIAVRSALASLAPGQRAVLVLRYLDDLTEAQTAQVLGISVGTVKSQASKALARLRDSGLLTEEDAR